MVIFNFLGVKKTNTMPVNLWSVPRVIFSSSNSDNNNNQVVIDSAILVSLHVACDQVHRLYSVLDCLHAIY